MQFWPRKRAKRAYARVRSWKTQKEVNLTGFAGYKAGMTHIMVQDTDKNSLTKGMEVFVPVTVVECPPLRIVAVRFYKNGIPAKDIVVSVSKELQKKTNLPQKAHEFSEVPHDDVAVLVYTQPKMIGFKKKPDVFEVKLSGTVQEKLDFVKNNINKDIKADSFFKEGAFFDTHVITKGKGFQGPVKRFGIDLRHHKSEKTKRGPGSLGGWSEQGHVMYRVAHAGQMGYHQRTTYNKQILKVSHNPEEVNPAGGFIHYGILRNPYVLVKGSVDGPKKRMILFTLPRRITVKKQARELPTITHISTSSKQGR